WKGSEKNKMLQRIYATAFWTKEDLKEHLDKLEEAERRDHRKLGTQLDLFSLREEVGAGLVLWHPNLGVVRQMLEDYWRQEHRRRGYDIIYTPHIAKSQLWDISGHNEHFKDNMFYMEVDEQDYVLRPMNCPFHMLIYQAKRHSYRNLPLRYAELGTVYRYERSGALHGMTRVRGFTQDDAHIFCTQDQFIEEIKRIIDLVDHTLKLFDLEYTIELSTRPEGFVGSLEIWEKAEAGLKQAMEEKNLPYVINEGDGAFYGPKLDFKLKDALGRTWQGATIQLDFNLPIRFDLKYTEKDGSLQTPVMIHRVIYGTLERFIGILIEHYAGAFPTWLAPEQVVVIPIAERHVEYANSIYNTLKDMDIRAHLDDRSESMNYKIREAQVNKVPYMMVIGDREIETNQASIRTRTKGDLGSKDVKEFIELLKQEIDSKKSVI
ncbi:MAG TPA: threonine--tRNA ligase, partial [Cyanobacteria bacterium UBA9579]|nr:threonine--tRNA ligase [Cyanobacteria bacterium UBA9579]